MKPGSHTIYLYDPEIRTFFKKENVIVYPLDRKDASFTGSLIQPADGRTPRVFDLLDISKTQLKLNLEFKIVAQTIFGIDQVCNYSQKMCDHIFDREFDKFRIEDVMRYMSTKNMKHCKGMQE